MKLFWSILMFEIKGIFTESEQSLKSKELGVQYFVLTKIRLEKYIKKKPFQNYNIIQTYPKDPRIVTYPLATLKCSHAFTSLTCEDFFKTE